MRMGSQDALISSSRCPCGHARAPLALACDRCGVLFSDRDKANAGELTELEKHLIQQVWRRVTGPFLLAFAIFTTVTGGGLYQIWRSLRDAVYVRIDAQFQDPAIRETFVAVANAQAKKMMAEDLQPELEGAKQQLAVELAKFETANSFSLTMLAAQADNRLAFDQLESWAGDSTYEFSTFAAAAWLSILDAHNPPMRRSGLVPQWPDGVDPSALTLLEIKAVYNAAAAFARPAILEAVWNRDDISKQARLQFMMEVMLTDESLNAVEQAGYYFTRGTEQKIKPLAVKHLSAWWIEHKRDY